MKLLKVEQIYLVVKNKGLQLLERLQENLKYSFLMIVFQH